jgi:hypothetical protein
MSFPRWARGSIKQPLREGQNKNKNRDEDEAESGEGCYSMVPVNNFFVQYVFGALRGSNKTFRDSVGKVSQLSRKGEWIFLLIRKLNAK